MPDFMAKMHQIRFRLGLRPRPRWGAYSAPQTPSWILEDHLIYETLIIKIMAGSTLRRTMVRVVSQASGIARLAPRRHALVTYVN